MTNTNLRTLTQNDVNKMVLEEVRFWNTYPIDWDLLASDVYNMVQRMRRHDVIGEVYDLEGMIDNAIEEFN